MTEMQKNGFEVCNGYYIKKEGHRIHRNRDGYAKRCYGVYESKEDMINGVNGRQFITIKDARDYCYFE